TLKAIAEICVKHGIVLINDEIYGRLVYDMPVQKHVLELVPEARDVTLNINGVSKSYAMTGWRLGYALGPAPLIKAMNSMQGHLTSGTCSITQWAATGAIENAEADIERMRVQFDKRRHLICGLLDDIRGLTYVKPQGAFYTFINVSAYLGEKTGMADDIAFCERVLAQKALALVPGTAFLCPGWVRISYSCNEETIKAGIARLKEFVESL
ncbi:MAG: aminotransferase class I/II-fold pyridoxal phosphate-dependent enzyme, partial [Pyramidobacter sp.]|nr:aminotransferase class I/II-fold pyridoxal phosphate-dependent enzyme [Pyramidobacter sp.]